MTCCANRQKTVHSAFSRTWQAAGHSRRTASSPHILRAREPVSACAGGADGAGGRAGRGAPELERLQAQRSLFLLAVGRGRSSLVLQALHAVVLRVAVGPADHVERVVRPRPFHRHCRAAPRQQQRRPCAPAALRRIVELRRRHSELPVEAARDEQPAVRAERGAAAAPALRHRGQQLPHTPRNVCADHTRVRPGQVNAERRCKEATCLAHRTARRS